MMFLPLIALLACEEESELLSTNVETLRVEPETLELETRLGEPASAQFEALATFSNGEEAPIDMVAWSVSSNSAGTIDDSGLFLAAESNGGHTLVTASHLGIEASAEVRVVYVSRTLEDGLDEAVSEAFDQADPSDNDALELLYPFAGVAVPRNLEGLAFLWSTPSNANVCRLGFQSELTDLAVLTEQESWVASSDLWTLITATNRESEVQVGLQCGYWDGQSLSEVQVGPSISLLANRFDAPGSVLYWETTNEVVVRLPVGELERSTFWPPEDRDIGCVGCHTLVEATQELVVTHDGQGGTFTVIDIDDPEAPVEAIMPDDQNRLTWHAVSPDGEWMLAVLNQELILYELDTGQPLYGLDMGGERFTQPDWSPDGETLVMVRITDTWRSDMAFYGGEIVLAPWQDGKLGELQVIVPAEEGYNHYAPAFSPDGEWIAYNRSTDDAYSDHDAELWLISFDGQTQLSLDAANHQGEVANSMPRWAPLPDDDVLWLAYSSTIPYPLRSVETQEAVVPQIWISAIDPSLAEQGEDPSSTPFWLPGQDWDSNNHVPVWWTQ